MARYRGLTTYGGNREARVYNSLKYKYSDLQLSMYLISYLLSVHFDRLKTTPVSESKCT